MIRIDRPGLHYGSAGGGQQNTEHLGCLCDIVSPYDGSPSHHSNGRGAQRAKETVANRHRCLLGAERNADARLAGDPDQDRISGGGQLTHAVDESEVVPPPDSQRPRTQWHDKYRQKVQTSGPFFSWC